MSKEEIDYMQRQIEAANQKTREALDGIRLFAKENASGLKLLWSLNDGEGGAILDAIASEIGIKKKIITSSPPVFSRKQISGNLRIKVYERDKYRCVNCGTHENLSCDHIKPVSKGGTNALENLQTLCCYCNSKKGVK